MGVYLRGRWYYLRKMIEGRRRWKSLRIRRGQEALLSERLEQVENQVIAEHYGLEFKARKPIRLSEAIEDYKTRKQHKSTLVRDVQRLEFMQKIMGDKPLRLLGRADFQKLEEALFSSRPRNRESRSEATVNRYFELLRHVFNLAVEDGHLKENPLRRHEFFVESPGRRALQAEEIKAVVQAARRAQDEGSGRAFRVIHDMIWLALLTGMRLGEILNLKWAYLQGEFAIFPIRSFKSRRRERVRRQRSREVFLPEPALAIIRRQPRKNEYVFDVWRHGNAVSRPIQKIRELSGVADLSFHMLRHTFGTILSGETDPVTTQSLMGHGDYRTTARYLHGDSARRREASRRLECYLQDVVGESEVAAARH